jgi:F-type H+-transporting ATPase subunit b
MGLLNSLGFSWQTFISQLINFALLYFILKKFALDKIIKALDGRQRQIDEGVKNAGLADVALQQAKKQQDEIIATARKQAREVIIEARSLAQEQEKKIITEAKNQARKIVSAGEKQVQVEHDKMLLEVKDELAEIITIGVERLVETSVNPQEVTTKYLHSGLKA